jgi:drug/metabolite transporter (DMT)-like permease
MATALLAAALACTAFAQFSYKLYYVRNRQRSILIRAIALFALAQLGFFFALTQLEIGVVYMSTGLIQVVVLALSRFALKEHVTGNHVFAVLLIVGGLFLYAG